MLVRFRDRLLLDLLDEPHRDRRQPSLGRLPRGHPKGRDRGAGVAISEASDPREHIEADHVTPEAFPHPSVQDFGLAHLVDLYGLRHEKEVQTAVQ